MSMTKAAGNWRRALILGLLPLSALYFLLADETGGTQPIAEQHAAEEVRSKIQLPLPEMQVDIQSSEPVQDQIGEEVQAPPEERTSASEPMVLAREFDRLMETAQDVGGAALKAAFAIHDQCAGVPRSKSERDHWYVNHASDINLDVEAFEMLFDQCADVPVLPFNRRLSLIAPHAEAGDVTAQFLAGTSYPLGSDSRIDWLRSASEEGHAESMLALAESILAVRQSGPTKISAWKLVNRALEQGQEDAQFALEDLVASMTTEELKLASDQYMETGTRTVSLEIEKELYYSQ